MPIIQWLGRIETTVELLSAGEVKTEEKSDEEKKEEEQEEEEKEEGEQGVHRVQMEHGRPNCEYYWDIGWEVARLA